MRGRSQKKLLFAMFVLAVLAVLGYFFRDAIHTQFNWTRLWSAVARARFQVLALSIAVMFVAYGLRALRWKRFCRSMGPCAFAGVYSATLMGYTGLLLLGRAGEPVRPLLLARKCRFSISSMFGIWLLERLFDLAATAVFLGLSLALPSRLLESATGVAWESKFRDTGGVLFVALIGLMAVVIYFRLHGAGAMDRALAGWRAGSGWRHRVATQFAGFSEGLQAIRTAGDLAEASFYTAVHWTCIAYVYLLVAHSFSGRLSQFDFRAGMLVLIFTMVGSTVQLPGVGGGTQVLAFFAYTAIFGVDRESAAAAAIVLWVITFAVVCVAGIPLLINEGWSLGDLRRMAHDEAEAEKAGGHISAASDAPSGVPLAQESESGGDAVP